MSDSNVRVRFAPSPTGPLHMGGVRTALYNYLFAKQLGGVFILRLEDTDQTRFVAGAEDYIVEALKWCGISPDEGVSVGGPHEPYRQSERKPMYRKYAEELIEKDLAYYAFDTSEELEAVRERAKEAGNANFQYNYITRNSMKNSLTLPAEEVQKRLESGEPYTIRIKLPRNEEVKFEDMIRGWVSVNTANMDDKILLKADGMPTYHLANIVDDHTMEISHVIRGEEWLPSAPLHIIMYQYFGWEAPKFAHLPLLLRPDGNGKLSKRDGDRLGFPVFPLRWENKETGDTASGYREQGFFPEAFINMLAFLGWSPGDNREMFVLEELVKEFNISKVSKSGAKFDFEKAKWYNQQYLRKLSNEELATRLKPILEEKGIEIPAHDTFIRIIDLVKERAVFVEDIYEEGHFLFHEPRGYDEKSVSKKWKGEESAAIVRDLADRFANEEFTATALENNFKAYLNEKGLGFGQAGPVLRIAVVGTMTGPSAFEMMELLGKEETIRRMNKTIEDLS
ncbi:MAG: glutamate--tRNA ligase [Flavobacteriia bacterium]|nr:glutamate--tRNA ligase [Flavobacteriia bacterium]